MTDATPAGRPPDRDEDARLLIAIAGADDMALRMLYERHAPWLAVRLRRSLPASAVEDVLQESFLAVWRGASGYDGRGDAGAWLWGIARRQAATWLRRHGRPVAVLPDEVREPVRDLSGPALDRIELERAFAALGPDTSPARRLADLVLVQERPLREAADALGIPEGTVKSRMHTIRRRLRQALGKEEAR